MAGGLGFPLWGKGALVFEDSEAKAQEFVHESADHAHFAFAGGFQAFGLGAQNGVVSEPHDRWKVEGSAQSAIAGFTEAGFALDGFA